MQNLLETFRKIGFLSPDSEAGLLHVIEKREIPARTILLEQGAVCKKIYFVESGIARTYYYKDGKDITYWIAPENDFVGSMTSFFMQTASNKLVATIEDCVLWEFDHDKWEAFLRSNPAFEKIGRLFANYGISMMEARFDNLHFHSARERYELLLAQHPLILQQVPLGMIASYLGMTQETLSRIRR